MLSIDFEGNVGSLEGDVEGITVRYIIIIAVGCNNQQLSGRVPVFSNNLFDDQNQLIQDFSNPRYATLPRL